MRKIILLFSLFLLLTGAGYDAQVSFYDLSFQADSVTAPFKPANTAYAYVRSKRGTDGVNKTTSADSVLNLKLPITKIVLVYTESSSDALANREEYNQERWENLILTYPEFFQEKTSYKNVCQCSPEADGEDYKHAQGFYIYYKSSAPPPAKKTEEPPPPPPAAKTEAPAKPKQANEPTPAKKAETPVAKAEVVTAKQETKAPEPAAKEETKKTEEPVAKKTEDDEAPAEKPAASKKKVDANKPRKAKDNKACRPACYGWGEEDLNQFFKDQIVLTKKQKRKWKKSTCDIRIQLSFDGTIKKSMIAGANADLNAKVTDALKNMNSWNAAVKNGMSIKSEVKITLKFDPEWRVFKAHDVQCSPKLPVKCKCASDAEIFGD